MRQRSLFGIFFDVGVDDGSLRPGGAIWLLVHPSQRGIAVGD